MSFTFAEDIVSAVTREECEALAGLAAGKKVLELGAWLGRSTIALASVAAVVHTVDWHLGDPHAGEGDTLTPFLANIERYGVRKKIILYLGRNEAVLPCLRSRSFDLVFIDSYHTEEAVVRDLRDALPLVREDGHVAFHDYLAFGGVKAVVDAFAATRKTPLTLVNNLAIVKL